jgi:acyl-CoA thioesterase
VSFQNATTATQDHDGRWTGEIHDGWDIGGNANGGYLLAVTGRAMAMAADQPDVATITAHFLRPGPAGQVSIQTEIAKQGRRFSTVQATMSREKSILTSLGAFTDHAANPDDRSFMSQNAPDWGDPLDQPRIEGTDTFPPPIVDRVDVRLHPDDNFYLGPSGVPRMRGWIRLLDDEPWDSIGLLLASDVFPPTIFNADFGVAWVPTIELTVHVRNRPAPGWLRCEFTSRFVTGGFVEEDGLMWDSDGALVAQSRQISLLPRPQS